MFSSRALLATLAVAVVLLAPVAAPSPAAASPARPVEIEAGLLPGPGVLTNPAALRAAPASPMGLIVRLAGPSLTDIVAAHRGPATPRGDQVLAPRTLESLKAAMIRSQAPAVARLEAAGATVVSSYQAVLNGFLVYAEPAEIAAIARVPGVVSIARAPRHTLDLEDSVVFIGAQRVIDELDIDGTGTIVAVIDTGTDYTHLMFGGPGTVEAFNANDENVVEPGSFPTAKVVGGYDFAGQFYSPDCVEAPTPTCTGPDPDDDPLDPRDLAHGTHVASTVLGVNTPKVHNGVAPGAKLVSLKVFGNPTGGSPSTDLSNDAIEWAVQHNLGMDVPGTAPDGKIDVINMSLGSGWGPATIESDRVVESALEAGITLVASAGNSGNIPYITGTPAAAEMALSVASSFASGEEALGVKAEWKEGGQDMELVTDGLQAAEWTAQLEAVIKAPLAWYGLACSDANGDPTPPEQDVREKIALIERGTCAFYDKLWNAQKEGAVAALVFTSAADKTVMGCGAPSDCANGPDIPGVMIDRQPGLDLKSLLVDDGLTVTVTFDPNYMIELDYLTDTISGFSSRGPGRFRADIKPQITAPGSNIVAAAAGSGDEGVSFSGTSMAGPHVAGVAALLWQRNRDDDLELAAADISALMMNYAVPTIRVGRNDTGDLGSVARQGAGRVDAFRSAEAGTLVRSDEGIAELNFGDLQIAQAEETFTRTLTVRNLSEAAKSYAFATTFAFEDDEDAGVALTFEPERLTVPAGQTREVEVTLTATQAELREWDLRGFDAIRNVAHFQELEVDGWVDITEVDAGGQPVQDGDALVVPFYSMPRAASCVDSLTPESFVLDEVGGAGVLQTWTNPCALEGHIEVTKLIGTDGLESTRFGDEFPAEVDLEGFGARHYKADDGSNILEFQVRTVGSRRLPLESEFHIYLDLDEDGVYDRAVYNVYAPAFFGAIGQPTPDTFAFRWMVGHAPLVPDTLLIDYGQTANQVFLQPYNLDESVTTLQVSADDLGLDLNGGEASFRAGVAVIETVDDYPYGDHYIGVDYMPDSLEDGGGFPYRQEIADCLKLVDAQGTSLGENGETLVLNGGVPQASVSLKLQGCSVPNPGMPIGLLMAYPRNADDADAADIRRGVAGKVNVYLPYAGREHVLKPEPVTFALGPAGESGISGSATLTERTAGLEVQLTVMGSPEGASHPAFLRKGTCANPMETEHALTNVVGGGSMTTVPGKALADVQDGNHSVSVHMSNADLAVVACGDIPGQ